jgi:uncharacterized protein
MTMEPDASDPIMPAAEPAPLIRKPSGFRDIFIGPNGIRAGWRFAIFVVLFLALQYLVIQRGLRLIPAARDAAQEAQAGGVITLQFELIFEGAGLGVVLLAGWIMSRIENRPFGEYGIPLEGAFGKPFWQGAVWGLGFVTLEMVIIAGLGGFSFGAIALAGLALVKYAVLWAIGFVLVGLFEEFLFRGYAQYTLESGIGFWASAFLLSAIFGATHLTNPGEGWVGALSVFTFGMFACLTLRRTGNLWFAIGFHAAGDYAETFIFSTPDSGLLAQGHLLNSTFHGPRWLTGGTIGPEGSAIDFVVFLLAFIAFARLYPPKGAPSKA